MNNLIDQTWNKFEAGFVSKVPSLRNVSIHMSEMIYWSGAQDVMATINRTRPGKLEAKMEQLNAEIKKFSAVAEVKE
jgi:hypothetical protein